MHNTNSRNHLSTIAEANFFSLPHLREYSQSELRKINAASGLAHLEIPFNSV